MSRFNFDATIAALRETQGGRERNMYAGVKDLFMHSLGHSASNVLVDTAATQASGIPDLMVMAPTGITDKNGKAQLCEWLVVEVKDEPGVFKEPSSRETVFEGKAKYIGIFTEWFLLIDPQVMVLRPVTMRSQLKFDPAQDIVLELATLTENQFKTAFNMLLAEHAGVSNALKAFRAGDVSKIAAVQLRVSNPSSLSKAQTQRLNHAKKDFFDAVSSATMMLQQACIQALDAQAARVAHITQEAQTFSDQWQGYELEFSPFRLEGRLQEGPSAVREHDVQAARLKRDWMRTPALAKLALKWLPAFHERMGSTRKDHHFATETANLILARILLIRFFEDHGFFGEKKYVCNGGVEAFQKLMTYFGEGYTQLLRHAYEKAHDIYAAVFDEMDLDWVLGVENAQLSKAIEMSMMLLSRFDFTTVKGDILTGIYDRFLDPKKRKDLGEYYTPPTIARYMVRHLGLQIGDSVVDPACGSGTFLLETYQHLVGDDIEQGTAGFEQALTVLNTVQGIDLNPFSAMIAQVQMLWHLLPMKTQLMAAETFPDIRIAERMNALIQNGTEHRGSLFSEINQAVHAAVVGNPPYVRPERNTQPLFGSDASWFAPMGSAEKNLFSLFIYKALAGMCRPANAAAGIAAGKLAFVVPLSFCDNDDNAALRNLFRIGGQFTVLEVVDLEVIAPQVFDAAVNPIVLIAQNRPATAQDKVCIRVAGPECVLDAEGRQFDLERASKALFDYADVWTKDGRILTKITAQRLPILRKLTGLDTLEQAACTFWVGKRGARIDSWQLDKPKRLPIDGMLKGVRWEEQSMIRRGAVFRNKKPLATTASNRFNFYKGENIAACAIEGDPVEAGIDIDGVDDNALWRFRDILPSTGFAALQITLGITVAPFDPREQAFLDTATLFFPKPELAAFPFDLALLSRVYQYYYGLSLRLGAVQKLYSHLYPTNFKMLPWTAQLADHADAIEAKRAPFLAACKALHNRNAALQAALAALPHQTFTDSAKGQRITWAEALQDGKSVDIDSPALMSRSIAPVSTEEGGGWRVQLNSDLFAYVIISDESLAQRLNTVLTAWHGETVSTMELFKLKIPTAESAADFEAQVHAYDAGGSGAAIDTLIDEIDTMVGTAFGLSTDEIASVQLDMRSDPFLRKIRPNLPFTGKKHRGSSTALASAQRYQISS
jgi:hypothetical protein